MTIPKHALVTGSGRRIGRAIAIDLARNGWSVAVHYHTSQEDAEAVAAEIVDAGGKAVTLAADLRDESQVDRLISDAADALGPIGCLVNNASRFERDEADTATRESWDGHLDVNLRAPFVLIQKMAQALPDDAEGVVVNMLDERVWNLTPHFTSYTVSKAALWTLTQTLALALAPKIRVNAIGPGPTLASPRQTPAQFQEQYESMPLRRAVDPQEICDAVRFIIDAGSMTGQMLALDSGQHLAWTQPTVGQSSSE
jgi:NAD(P)-dependent dehydrogenase (short-subunit alcohol dehydrogenase family)